METVAIVGVGLIGGSFGLALRDVGFNGRIIGVSSERTTRAAIERGAIDEAATFESATGEADLVFLAAPILKIIEQLDRLDLLVKPGTLITDAGSTKSTIVRRAREAIRHSIFLGGHPMAGKEKSGIAEAGAGLFRDRPWAICPNTVADIERQPVAEFIDWLKRIGARPVVLSPEEHDTVVAYTSHLPQMLSTSLAACLRSVPDPERLAGPAILDLTRLASSPYAVWRDILVTNETEIRRALERFLGVLSGMSELIGNEKLSQLFETAQDVSAKLRRRVS
jgi:prephenate dehydrogenase